MSDKNLRHESDYWDDFYARWEIDIPSQFCVMLATEEGLEVNVLGLSLGVDPLDFALKLPGVGRLEPAKD